jgi:hypothetical protein
LFTFNSLSLELYLSQSLTRTTPRFRITHWTLLNHVALWFPSFEDKDFKNKNLTVFFDCCLLICVEVTCLSDYRLNFFEVLKLKKVSLFVSKLVRYVFFRIALIFFWQFSDPPAPSSVWSDISFNTNNKNLGFKF